MYKCVVSCIGRYILCKRQQALTAPCMREELSSTWTLGVEDSEQLSGLARYIHFIIITVHFSVTLVRLSRATRHAHLAINIAVEFFIALLYSSLFLPARRSSVSTSWLAIRLTFEPLIWRCPSRSAVELRSCPRNLLPCWHLL